MIRDDLKLAAYAVALGYELRTTHGRKLEPDLFAAGIPPEPLSFTIGLTSVWETARGWRVARLGRGGTFEPPADEDFSRRLLPALVRGVEVEKVALATIDAARVASRIKLNVATWRDRTYGNTYFSLRAHAAPGAADSYELVLTLPFQLGSCEHAYNEGLEALERAGYMPGREERETLREYLRRNRVELLEVHEQVSKARAMDWGTK